MDCPLLDLENVDIFLKPLSPHHGLIRNKGEVMSEGGYSFLAEDGGVLRGLLGFWESDETKRF